jgi:hypothetical protein
VEHEVRDRHIGRVLALQAVEGGGGGGIGDAEVLDGVGIGGEGKHGQEERQEDDIALQRLHSEYRQCDLTCRVLKI